MFVLQHRQYRCHGFLAGDQCRDCDAAHRFITIRQSDSDTLRRPTSSRRQLIADYSSCRVGRADSFLEQILRQADTARPGIRQGSDRLDQGLFKRSMIANDTDKDGHERIVPPRSGDRQQRRGNFQLRLGHRHERLRRIR